MYTLCIYAHIYLYIHIISVHTYVCLHNIGARLIKKYKRKKKKNLEINFKIL